MSRPLEPRSGCSGRSGRFVRKIFPLAILLSALAAHSRSFAGGAFYVDGSSPSCSDGGSGSSATPYCTISAAARTRGGAGTTILVAPGIYREMVTIPAAGAPGNRFVLQAAAPGVVIDGADDLSAAWRWTRYSGSVFVAAAVNWSPQQVFIDDVRLSSSTAAPETLDTGQFVFVSGQGLFVNLGGDNPGDHGVLVGHRLNGFRLPGRPWVTIDGFSITRSEDHAIAVLAASDNVVLTHNTIRNANKQGINATGSSNLLIASNNVSCCNGHGIYLVTGVTASAVEDNECFLNARPIVKAANGIQLFGSSGNTVRRNRLHDNQDSGLQINAASNDNVCAQNLSWNNGDHGFDHQGSTGTVHIGDVAWGNLSNGFSLTSSSTGTRLYDCIAAENGLGSRLYDLSVDATSVSGFASNSNIFWNSTSQQPVRYATIAYATVASYAAASGQDGLSTQADPRFTAPGSGDFRPAAGSPAIDSADSASPFWPATDAVGTSRLDDPATHNSGIGKVAYADRGALEFIPANLAPHGAIDAPAADVTISAGEGLVFAGSASDPDGDLPLTYLWTFSGAAPDQTVEDPGLVVFDRPGTYTVTFLVTDSRGQADLEPQSRTIVVISNRPPDATIDLPVSNLTISACESVLFASTGTDPDGDLPLTYQWSFGGGAPDQSVEDPGAVTFTEPGTYTVTLNVTDARGLADPTPAARVVTVHAPGPTDEVHWTIIGQNAVTFDWRGAESSLRYGLTTAYGQTVAATAPDMVPISSCGPFREAKLTGLQENTLYHYAIGGGPDHTFHTPPPRGTTGFTVYAQGDIGETSNYSEVALVQDLIAAGQPDFTLMLGDLTYANDHGQASVDQHFNDVMAWSPDAAYMPVWGNHEWDSPGHCSASTSTDCNQDSDCPSGQTCRTIGDDLRNYKGRFDLPNPQTSIDAPGLGCCGEDWSWFDYGNVRFIAYPEPYSSRTWDEWEVDADAIMNDAQADPAIRFIVTYGHRPAYSSGHHPGARGIQSAIDALGLTHSKYILNLNGHSHNYERTVPRSGVIHVTDGGGGASLEQDGSCLYLTCEQPAWSVFRAMHLGPVRLRVTDAGIEGSFICGPPGGGTLDIDCVPGSVVDRFTIPPGPPDGVIEQPAGDVTIRAGQAVTFRARSSDENKYPLSYSWNFGGGAMDRHVEDPGPVVFGLPGTYVVSFTVSNSVGLVDPTPAIRTIVVLPALGGRSDGGVHSTE